MVSKLLTIDRSCIDLILILGIARFPKSVHGSAVWAGNLELEKAYNLRDVQDPNVTAIGELDRIGFKGETECSHTANPLAALFELHIGKCLHPPSAIEEKQ